MTREISMMDDAVRRTFELIGRALDCCTGRQGSSQSDQLTQRRNRRNWALRSDVICASRFGQDGLARSDILANMIFGGTAGSAFLVAGYVPGTFLGLAIVTLLPQGSLYLPHILLGDGG